MAVFKKTPPCPLKRAKESLKRGHWSYRSAAPFLGVGFVHLALVLNGKRKSERLLRAVFKLQPRLGATSCEVQLPKLFKRAPGFSKKIGKKGKMEAREGGGVHPARAYA